MQATEAKKTLKEALHDDLRFEGHFAKCWESLKDTQQQELIAWAKACREQKSNPIQPKQDRELIGFVKRFGSNTRAILTKKKGGYFIALYVDKHKYYEAEMEKLGF